VVLFAAIPLLFNINFSYTDTAHPSAYVQIRGAHTCADFASDRKDSFHFECGLYQIIQAKVFLKTRTHTHKVTVDQLLQKHYVPRNKRMDKKNCR